MIKWLIGLYLLLCWAPAPLSPAGDVSVAVGVLALVAFVLLASTARSGRLLGFAPGPALGNGAWMQLAALSFASVFLIAISAASALQAEVPLRAARIGFGHLSGLIIVWAMLREPQAWPSYLKFIIGGAVLSSLLGAGSYLVPALHSIMFGERDRTAVFFKQVNQLGIVLTCVFPFACAMFSLHYRSTLMRLCGPLLAPIVLAGIVATGSKTNLVIAAAGLCGFFVVASMLKQGGARRVLGLAVALSLLALIAPLSVIALEYLNPRAYAVLGQFLSGDTDIGSIHHRYAIWAYSIEAGIANPLTGEGPREVFGFPHAHNAILDCFRVLGFPGLVAILCFCGLIVGLAASGVLAALRGRPDAYWERRVIVAGAVSVLSYLVSNQMSDSFGPSTFPFMWAALGIMLCALVALRQPR